MKSSDQNESAVGRGAVLFVLALSSCLLSVCKRNHPPTVPQVAGQSLGRPGDTVRMSALSTDRDGDLVSYLFAWGDTSSAEWSPDYPGGVTVTRGHVYADSGSYSVRARARDDKESESDWSDSVYVLVGYFPPGVPSVPAGPTSGETGTPYQFSTEASSPFRESIFIQFDWGGNLGGWSGPVASDSPYIVTQTFDTSGRYSVKARAKDRLDSTSAWSGALSVDIVAVEPHVPAKPIGPREVEVDDTAAYSSVTTDPNGCRVLYVFDWGDGVADTTALLRSGDTATATHAWSGIGTFPVRVKAENERGRWSINWSDTLNVAVDTHPAANHVPDPPLKPTHTGPDSVGKPEVFTTSATDPDGDTVQIKFYFGEGGTPSYGPLLASGATYTDTVVYMTSGYKVVYAVAMDARGDTSAWSAPDSIFINSPNVPPHAPTIVTRYMPAKGIANGPRYRLYANAYDEYGDSLYYRWYFDGTDSVTSRVFPSGVDGYAEWTPTTENHTYALQVRVFDVTGKTNDTLPMTTFQTVTEGQVIWGIAAEFIASPAIGTSHWRGGTWPAIICGSTDEHLYVIDAYQSFLISQVSVPNHREYVSSPTIGSNGTRYVGNENGNLYAIGPGDTINWQFNTGGSGMNATAALGNGGIYCGGEDRRIHKLIDNGKSVTQAWSYRLRHEITSSPAIGPDGKVVCCDDSGYVYSLNDDGTLNWEVRTGDLTGIHSSPAIVGDGTVYVGTESGNLFVLMDGAIAWSYATNPRFSISSSPIIGPDGSIYFGCDDGKLYRLDKYSHLPVPNWPVTVSSGAVSSTPLLCADGMIYIADDDSLYAFDADNPTGGRRWAVALKVPPMKGSPGHRPQRLSLDNQPSAVVDQYGIIYIATESGDGAILAVAGRPGGTLAWTDWPMFHHDARHTGRFGARR